MARKKDPRLEKIRLEIVYSVLASNTKPKILAERFGISTDVVRRLIRESPEIPPLEQRVADLVGQGRPDTEIAARLGRSKRRILEIKQKLRGGPLWERPTTEQNIDRFFRDPVAARKLPFTKPQTFADALIARVLDCCERDPRRGLPLTVPVIALFEDQVRRRREPAASFAQCKLFQVSGIRASSLLMIKEIDEAWQIIIRGLEAQNCDGCFADYLRRAGLALAYWGHSLASIDSAESMKKLRDGLLYLDNAIAAYRQRPDSDHDLHGCGIAHCFLNRAALRHYLHGGEAGAEDARAGLSIVSPESSPALHGLLLHELAANLMAAESPEGRPEARQILDTLLEKVRTEVSAPALRLRWTSGLLHAMCGDVDLASDDLSDALSDAINLSLQAEVAAISADLCLVDPDPATVSAEIESLCGTSTSESPIKMDLPTWISGNLGDKLRALYIAACRSAQPKTLRSLSRSLREAAGEVAEGLLMPAPTSLADAYSMRS